MMAHKGKLGAVLIALAVSSPAWAHLSKMDKCTEISGFYGNAVRYRNEGRSPKYAYNLIKESPNPKNFGELFSSRKKENAWLKRVVNKVYFNKHLQRTTENQVKNAVLNNCLGEGRSQWHRLKTH